MYNILTEPLIRIDTPGRERIELSLPLVYAALMADEVEAFPALRPHQRHAWHACLVQLSAMAMHRAGLADLPETAEEWAGLLRGLTPDWPEDEPWHLVVEDITSPAFMQPPASSATKAEEYGTKSAKRGKQTVRVPDEDKICRYPDKLDMLVTSKNHDLKAEVAEQAQMDDWIFALVTLQTMEGYGGAGNYGISRMPSGYGNRPAFSLTPSARPGGHVKHDLIALLKHRKSMLEEYPTTESGISLMWIIPWDGTEAESMLLTDMEPYYIEICRRVRLRRQSGKLVADRANSEPRGRRVVDAKGLTGDPWAPVSNNANPRGTPPTFLGPRKFGYERVVDGLFSPDWRRPLLLTPEASGRGTAGDMQLVARGIVRGEGGTEGYHERIIPLRHRTLQVFGRPGGAKQLEDIARERIERVAVVQRILRHAVSAFAAGGKTESIADEHRARANPWANKLTEIVDEDFFENLQDEANADATEHQNVRRDWLSKVVGRADSILREATASLPCPEIRRPMAQVQAEGVFWGRVRGPNGLTELFQEPDEREAQ